MHLLVRTEAVGWKSAWIPDMLRAASPPFMPPKVDVDMLFGHAEVRSLVESSRRTQLFKVGTVDRSMPVDV